LSYNQYFQGDVWLMNLDPKQVKITKEEEIKAIDGKLVLLEGEMTGHHHHIQVGYGADVMDRPSGGDSSAVSKKMAEDMKAMFNDSSDVATETVKGMFSDSSLASKFSGKTDAPVAKMFKAAKTAQELVSKGILTRADLIIGLLEIEGGPMKVVHQEHSAITLPPGSYIVGRQIESVAGEERRVAD
jgi:hypothetical protein